MPSQLQGSMSRVLLIGVTEGRHEWESQLIKLAYKQVPNDTRFVVATTTKSKE